MTKITGYRARFLTDGMPGHKSRQDDFETHLELQHGWEDEREFVQNGAMAQLMAEVTGRPAWEIAHELEHAEGFAVPSWRGGQHPEDPVEPEQRQHYSASYPHHHVGDIFVIDMELDLDDDMLEDQP